MAGEALARRLWAEAIGTGLLVATVVGSGIMAERLSAAAIAQGDVALALLCNTIPTGAILYVLITCLGPVSGAHFNPAVSLAMVMRKRQPLGELAPYAAAQIAGGVIGAAIAHLMFDLAPLTIGVTERAGLGQWLGEITATFGLVFIIFGAVAKRPDAVAASVGLYITAAYWFTSSTSFANPAVTIARSFTQTFSGIAPGDAVLFILMQIIGGLAGAYAARAVFGDDD